MLSKTGGCSLCVCSGVSQLAVAVNKMDTVEWTKTRFDEIVRKLKHFLKQAGFKVHIIVTHDKVVGMNGQKVSWQRP